MSADRTCSQCGAELEANGTHGLCANCFARASSQDAQGTVRDPDQLTAGSTTASTDSTLQRFNDLTSGSEHIGHYKLLQKIGEGGFGVVYLAEQEQPVKR